MSLAGHLPDDAERPRRSGPSVRTRVTEYTEDGSSQREDRLVAEEPLEIRLAWPGTPARSVWVTMRTPGDDFELAAGLLVHEGLLPAGLLHGVAYCTDQDLTPQERFNVVTVTLRSAPPRPVPARSSGALSSGSSACGVCGSDSVADALAVVGASTTWRDDRSAAVGARPGADGPDADLVRSLPERLRQAQRVFDHTGGLHAAGLFDSTGTPLAVREDVGRHNAVDKVTGARVLAGADPGAAALVVSGRAGFELVQKAVAAGVAAFVAVGAPSSLACELADRAGLPLFGFTSPRRTVRYC